GKESAETMPPDAVQQSASLIRLKGFDFVFRNTRRINECCDVSGDDAPTERLREGRPQNRTRVLPAPRTESSLAQIIEPNLDLLWTEFLQRDSSDVRDDVKPNDLRVAYKRSRSEPRLRRLRQPLIEKLFDGRATGLDQRSLLKRKNRRAKF